MLKKVVDGPLLPAKALACVAVMGHKGRREWGVINEHGQWHIEPHYEFLGGFVGDYCVFWVDGTIGAIDKSGAEVIAPGRFRSLRLIRNSKYFGFRENGADSKSPFGIGHVDRGVVLSPRFREFQGMQKNDGVFGVVDENGKGWFSDIDGNRALPGEFDELPGQFVSHRSRVKVDGKFGYVDDEKGAWVIKPEMKDMTVAYFELFVCATREDASGKTERMIFDAEGNRVDKGFVDKLNYIFYGGWYVRNGLVILRDWQKRVQGLYTVGGECVLPPCLVDLNWLDGPYYSFTRLRRPEGLRTYGIMDKDRKVYCEEKFDAIHAGKTTWGTFRKGMPFAKQWIFIAARTEYDSKAEKWTESERWFVDRTGERVFQAEHVGVDEFECYDRPAVKAEPLAIAPGTVRERITTMMQQAAGEPFTPAFLVRKLRELGYVGNDEAVTSVCSAMAEYSVALYHRKVTGKYPPKFVAPRFLVAGATGNGKTHLFKLLFGDIFNMPIVKETCEGMTSAGYIGKNFETVHPRVHDAKQYGDGCALLLDEFDKLRVETGPFGQRVQFEMMPVVAGDVVIFKNDGKLTKLDYGDVPVVLLGSFYGIGEALRAEKVMGFVKPSEAGGGDVSDAPVTGNDTQYRFSEAFRKDCVPHYVKFGIIPELVNRVTNFAFIQPLSSAQLEEILVKFVEQKEKMLSTLLGVKVVVRMSEKRRKEIVAAAVKNNRGGRVVNQLEAELTARKYDFYNGYFDDDRHVLDLG